MFGRNSIYILVVMLLLGFIAFLAWAAFLAWVPPARADGGFAPGQKVSTARTTTAFFNACNAITPSGSDYRGFQFSTRKGEELTVTANATGEFRIWCSLHRSWAIRVVNGRGEVGWVYEENLSSSKPKMAIEQVNACGAAIEDSFYTTANRVFATRNSNYFYWKSPYGVWGLLHWDGKSDPRPYWKK